MSTLITIEPVNKMPRYELPKQLTRTEAGKMMSPPVNRDTLRKYINIAIDNIPAFRKDFTFDKKIDSEAALKPRHIPVLREIRSQFYQGFTAKQVEDWCFANSQYLSDLLGVD